MSEETRPATELEYDLYGDCVRLERINADLLAALKETLPYLEGHHEALGHDNEVLEGERRRSKCHTCAQIVAAVAAIEKGERT